MTVAQTQLRLSCSELPEPALTLVPNPCRSINMLSVKSHPLGNERTLYDRYRGTFPVFSNDIQGLAAVVVAGILAAQPLTRRRLSEHTYLFAGEGRGATAAAEVCGQNQLHEWRGLLTGLGMPGGKTCSAASADVEFQAPVPASRRSARVLRSKCHAAFVPCAAHVCSNLSIMFAATVAGHSHSHCPRDGADHHGRPEAHLAVRFPGAPSPLPSNEDLSRVGRRAAVRRLL